MNDIETLTKNIHALQRHRAKLCRWLHGKHPPYGQQKTDVEANLKMLAAQIFFLQRQRLAFRRACPATTTKPFNGLRGPQIASNQAITENKP